MEAFIGIGAALLIAVLSFFHGRGQSEIIGGLQHEVETKDRKIQRLEKARERARRAGFDDHDRRELFGENPESD